MFDLLECKAVTFSLLRKQNGQYTRLPDDSQVDIMMRQEFRNFIYELQLHANKQANENVIRSYQFLFRQEVQNAKKSTRAMALENEQKKQVESKKRDSLVTKISGKALPRRKRALYASRILSFSQRAYYKDRWSHMPTSAGADGRASHTSSKYSGLVDAEGEAGNQFDWRDYAGEKGALLFRNIYHVRCITDGSEPVPKESVITLYLKEQVVQMEVLLYNDPSKMSIASEVNAIELFGEEPMNIPFKDRVTLLNSMMEKFFIISEDSVFHMKVESDTIPIQVFLEQQRKEFLAKNPKENKAQEYETIMTSQKVREI